MTEPTHFDSLEEALCRGLLYACREDLAALPVAEVLVHSDVREVKGAFLNIQWSLVKKAELALELEGCKGGRVRLCITRFGFGYGLWLIDRDGQAMQA